MSLLAHLHSLVSRPVEGNPLPVVPTRGGRDGPCGPDAVHLLIYSNPMAAPGVYGQGWTLVAWQGTERRWSVALDSHGAGDRAETRVAKAVAVRVLGDRGIRVERWSDGFVSDVPMHRAVPTTDPAGAAAGGCSVPTGAAHASVRTTPRT